MLGYVFIMGILRKIVVGCFGGMRMRFFVSTMSYLWYFLASHD